MNRYQFDFEYEVPEFGSVIVETLEDDEKRIKAIAMEEFTNMYPEAIEPEIVSWAKLNG